MGLFQDNSHSARRRCAGRKLCWVGPSEFIPREWKRCSITFASFHGVAPPLPLHVASDWAFAIAIAFTRGCVTIPFSAAFIKQIVPNDQDYGWTDAE